VFRETLPTVQEHPPLPPVTETMGDGFEPPSFRFEVLASPSRPRLWFLNQAQTELIQVQDNWFARNWRRLETDVEYPHYARVRDDFEDSLGRLLSFIEEKRLGEFAPTQAEVTYVNHLLAGDGWEGHGDLGKILRLACPEPSTEFLPKLESIRLAAQYSIRRDRAKPIGRMYVSAEPVFRRSDGRPMFVVTMTARGRPDSSDIPAIFDFLDLGHEWIVKGFGELTTGEIQKRWGREHG
jgi:uncharacterized protein (TIGR04255 family)